MQQKKKNNCYYYSYTLCTCNGSENNNKRCVGPDQCEEYVSEEQYFVEIMKKDNQKKAIKVEQTVTKPNKNYDLSLGKSKKALKREAKLEAEKNPAGSGFSLKDDPRFKDLWW